MEEINNKTNVHYKVLITAILVIGVIECVALMKGINGILLTTIVGAICLLAGKVMPQWKLKE